MAAETGSGKTLAYLLPVLHDLDRCIIETSGDTGELGPQLGLVGVPTTLILVPTQDLAAQVILLTRS